MARRTGASFLLVTATALLLQLQLADQWQQDPRCATPPDDVYVCDSAEASWQPDSFAYFAQGSLCKMNNANVRYAPAESCDCERQAAGNHFSTMLDCRQACIAPLTDALRCAKCPDYVGFACSCFPPAERWKYDEATRSCISYTYKGCGGCAQMFDTLAQCTDTCYTSMCNETEWPPWAPCIRLTTGGDGAQAQTQKPAHTVGDTLVLWYYVPTGAGGTGRCEQLVWRVARLDAGQGAECECGRNSNVYFDRYECERACAGRVAGATVDQKGRCEQPMDEGFDCDCYPSGEYWHWDAEAAAAERFHYRGCGGNGNRFATKNDCNALCL